MKINWRKFWKYELIAFLIVGLLYLISLWNGRNVFPENIYPIFVIPAIFGLMMLLAANIKYLENKMRDRGQFK